MMSHISRAWFILVLVGPRLIRRTRWRKIYREHRWKNWLQREGQRLCRSPFLRHNTVFNPINWFNLSTMAKKRKLSDLTTQETNLFLQMIENFKQELSEEDDDERSVISSLAHVAMKLQQVKVSPPLLTINNQFLTCLESNRFLFRVQTPLRSSKQK